MVMAEMLKTNNKKQKFFYRDVIDPYRCDYILYIDCLSTTSESFHGIITRMKTQQILHFFLAIFTYCVHILRLYFTRESQWARKIIKIPTKKTREIKSKSIQNWPKIDF